MLRKRGLGTDVLSAARARIAAIFDDFPRIYVSFSGGKDSSVMTHLVMAEARRRGRTVGLLFIDLEAQYRLTVEHVREMADMYADVAELWWVAVPLSLRNAVSNFEPQWCCWDPGQEADWVRRPPSDAVTEGKRFPFFSYAMEFEDFVEEFGAWWGEEHATCCLVGIRSDESLNRWRTLVADKQRLRGRCWTTWKGRTVFNAYPIYDWKTADLWTYYARTGLPHNCLYDRMHQAGLSPDQMRICQPYGDDQRKGLWLYHVIEPETWGRVVARVNGANHGALYARETGNILGCHKVTLPEGHTWQSFAQLLLDTLPPATKEHFENKISVFLKWYEERGYPDGIPDEADPKEEAAKKIPSWRRVCKTLLRNDYWCKGLSFSQHKSGAYEQYKRVMRRRREAWGI